MSAMPMPAVTLLYAGLTGILLIALAARVSGLRGRHKVGLGDGGVSELQRAIRVHGNTVEWAVPGLLLLLVAELNGASPTLLHAGGIAIVAGRVAFAIGLSRRSGESPGRMAGSILNWGAVLALALWSLWAFFRGS